MASRAEKQGKQTSYPIREEEKEWEDDGFGNIYNTIQEVPTLKENGRDRWTM